jgi:glycosyltransferase involved in cell wall biosynthesis
MKILILSSSHPYKAAGIVAKDLLDGLRSINGNEVKLVVQEWDRYHDKDIISVDSSFIRHQGRRFLRRTINYIKRIGLLKKRAKKVNNDYCIQDYDQKITYYKTQKILKRANFKPDAILVLFMQNFLSFKNLYELNHLTQSCIALYMPDMAPMTGGCHYAWNCKRYSDKCGGCPAYCSNNENDQSRINWYFKNSYIQKTNIIPVAASIWQWRQLNIASLYRSKLKTKILSITNEKHFIVGDKSIARSYFKINSDKFVILIGSVYNSDRRKGFNELMETFKILHKRASNDFMHKVVIAIIGHNNSSLSQSLPFSHIDLGYLSHSELVRAYQAADLFVSPSIEDSGPSMINQSLMCGLPVVAFEMGVAPDLIINHKTGYMAKLGDCEELANGIFDIISLEKSKYDDMRNECRKLALAKCSRIVIAKKFMKLLGEYNK